MSAKVEDQQASSPASHEAVKDDAGGSRSRSRSRSPAREEVASNAEDTKNKSSRGRSSSRSPSPRRTTRRSRSRSRSRSRRSPVRRRSRSRSRSRSRTRGRYHRDRRSSWSRSRSRSRSRSPRSSRRRYQRRRSPSPYERRGASSYDNGRHPVATPSKVLGVFGMSMHTREDALLDIFGRYGPIDNAVIIYDKRTGESRRFGFVTFKDQEDAYDARKALNGHSIDGRRVRVDFSITRQAHSPTPGRYMGDPARGRSTRDRYGRSRSRSRSRSPRR